MLEVCFSDSVKGALAFAQRCEDVIGGAESIAIISDKKGLCSFFYKKKALKEYKQRQAELQKQAVSLGGKKEDIVGISFCLSEGDIQSPINSDACPRREYLCSLFSFDRYNENEDMEKSINNFWQNCIKDIEKLKSKPEKIRAWVDNTPDAQCGLLYIANLLKDSETEIHIVELPKRIKRDTHCEIEYRGWGEVEPQLFGAFLENERILTHEQTEKLSNHWQMLKAENAPLRVVENGLVISADESYYDDLIRKEFPKESCKIANIIGSALGNHKVLTGDVFIAKRIQHFIDNGELNVLGKADNRFYSTIVSCIK